MNPVIESMTRIQRDLYVIRVWREEDTVKEVYMETMLEIEQAIWGQYNIKNIIQSICTLPRINAVEVTQGGNGTVYYPDWK